MTQLRVIVCKTVIDWTINCSATVKYSWCFSAKCEGSGARSTEKAAVTYLLEQVLTDLNIV